MSARNSATRWRCSTTYRARARDPVSARPGQAQRRHREGALHQPADRPDARPEHPGQAPGPLEARGRRVRREARRDPGLLTAPRPRTGSPAAIPERGYAACEPRDEALCDAWNPSRAATPSAVRENRRPERTPPSLGPSSISGRSGARRGGSSRSGSAGASATSDDLLRRLEPREVLAAVLAESPARVGGSVASGHDPRRHCCPHRDRGARRPPTSATFGCARSTASTSSGQTVSPPVRIASSAARRPQTARRRRTTRGRRVRSHPSTVNAAAVACGSAGSRPSASGPAISTSPPSPIRTSTSASGEPSYTTPPHVSVRPYVCHDPRAAKRAAASRSAVQRRRRRRRASRPPRSRRPRRAARPSSGRATCAPRRARRAPSGRTARATVTGCRGRAPQVHEQTADVRRREARDPRRRRRVTSIAACARRRRPRAPARGSSARRGGPPVPEVATTTADALGIGRRRRRRRRSPRRRSTSSDGRARRSSARCSRSRQAVVDREDETPRHQRSARMSSQCAPGGRSMATSSPGAARRCAVHRHVG